ncbi:uncharacterized protein GGS22DRAFT_136010 [Annulohypoxylon maeteangense]|uniref:uncharacterized protein n=1 Tax=Annulohypoxylon maeteangense TaxID=1927788 RepID=UPI002007BBEF|nr:uncharacterized protein GGS22DRAFT_136010 [Annulohypoxylon maeteangense]KAI0885921.1 hypothetical protein GGS22DRAFT_136010 [Annulohypoxylon maeteangense]
MDNIGATTKIRGFAEYFVASLKLDTMNWTEELRLIVCSCVLAAMIVKSISTISQRLHDYPACNFACNKSASYFYEPPKSLRRCIHRTPDKLEGIVIEGV